MNYKELFGREIRLAKAPWELVRSAYRVQVKCKRVIVPGETVLSAPSIVEQPAPHKWVTIGYVWLESKAWGKWQGYYYKGDNRIDLPGEGSTQRQLAVAQLLLHAYADNTL